MAKSIKFKNNIYIDISSITHDGKHLIDAMVETISNDDGTAIKFIDGTMICTIKKVIDDFSVSTPFNGFYIGNYPSLPFPVAFTELYSCQINPYVGYENCWHLSGLAPTNTEVRAGFIIGVKQFTQPLTLFITAIGTWK